MPAWNPEDLALIKQYGGETSMIVECFTHQICKKGVFNERDYHPGQIFDFKWIQDSIKAGKILNQKEYIVHSFDHTQDVIQTTSKKMSGGGQRTRFTIRELIKIFKTVEENPSKKNKNQVYWQRFIKKGYFPSRSVNSVNAQWQRFCHYHDLDEAIQKAI